MCTYRKVLIIHAQVPECEDHASFKRHNVYLKKEFLKRVPNRELVSQLMELSFAMRRNDIVGNAKEVKEIINDYPFLGDAKEVSIF